MSISYPCHAFLVSFGWVTSNDYGCAGLIIRACMKSVIDRADTRKARWEREVLEPTLKKSPEYYE